MEPFDSQSHAVCQLISQISASCKIHVKFGYRPATIYSSRPIAKFYSNFFG